MIDFELQILCMNIYKKSLNDSINFFYNMSSLPAVILSNY